EWRALQDTTNDPIAAMRRALPWPSWERSEDYYSERQLIWLDADTLIREKSGDRRSLDDFAKAFFGINDGSFVPSTYLFEDVVKALNSVVPYDWETFLRARLDGHGLGAPLDGVTRGGYRLVYTETPSDYFKSSESRRKVTDLTYSIGMVIGAEGRINGVLWEGPAFKKGMTVGTQIIAVNGVAFDVDRLKRAIGDAKQRGTINDATQRGAISDAKQRDAISDAKQNSSAIELLVKDGDRIRTVTLDYHDGLRYPHLERDPSAPARLDQILAPRK